MSWTIEFYWKILVRMLKKSMNYYDEEETERN